MTTAVGTRNDVVELESARGAASGCLAAAMIAAPHEASDRRWDVLNCPRRPLGLEGAEVLGVAPRSRETTGVDRDAGTRTLLPRLVATLAHDRRDLELRASGRRAWSCSFEDRSAQRRDERVLVEMTAVLRIQSQLRLPHAQDPVSGRNVSFTVWESEAHMRALRDKVPPGGPVAMKAVQQDLFTVVVPF